RARQNSNEAIDLPHRIASVFDKPIEAKQVRNAVSVVQQPTAVHTSGASRAAVSPIECLDKPFSISQNRMRETQHVERECRWLSMLEICLVRDPGSNIISRQVTHRFGQLRSRFDQIQESTAHVES